MAGPRDIFTYGRNTVLVNETGKEILAHYPMVIETTYGKGCLIANDRVRDGQECTFWYNVDMEYDKKDTDTFNWADDVYWDETNQWLTSTADGNAFIGRATHSAGNGSKRLTVWCCGPIALPRAALAATKAKG